MTFTAIGAAASAPKPPPLTMTPTAICGLLAGAKQVKTASLRPTLLTPFSAVPVLPAITILLPRVGGPAVWYAVPVGCWVTWIIICVISLATCGVTAWDIVDEVALKIVDRSGACTDCTR